MSYDVYIKADTGNEDRATVEEVGNMTRNVTGMWTEALRAVTGNPEHKTLGQTWGYDKSPICAEVLPVLEKAHQWMQNHKAELLPREATDCGGWGSYDGAVSFLGEIVAACRRHPKGYLYISY